MDSARKNGNINFTFEIMHEIKALKRWLFDCGVQTPITDLALRSFGLSSSLYDLAQKARPSPDQTLSLSFAYGEFFNHNREHELEAAFQTTGGLRALLGEEFAWIVVENDLVAPNFKKLFDMVDTMLDEREDDAVIRKAFVEYATTFKVFEVGTLTIANVLMCDKLTRGYLLSVRYDAVEEHAKLKIRAAAQR